MGVPRVSELAGWLGRPFGEKGIWSYSCEETRNEIGGVRVQQESCLHGRIIFFLFSFGALYSVYALVSTE